MFSSKGTIQTISLQSRMNLNVLESTTYKDSKLVRSSKLSSPSSWSPTIAFPPEVEFEPVTVTAIRPHSENWGGNQKRHTESSSLIAFIILLGLPQLLGSANLTSFSYHLLDATSYTKPKIELGTAIEDINCLFCAKLSASLALTSRSTSLVIVF